MLRSLNTAVTGLRGHQTRLDVIGNNIANVNTTGYKYSRVNFAESFAQTIKGATAPTATTGGNNPMLVGMGTQVQSIDCIHSQGSLQQTDKDTDIALNGPGYFIVKDKSMDLTSYTRNGDLGLNADGYLVTQDGLMVQGWTANSNQYIDTVKPTGDLKIPVEEPLAPKETTKVNFGGNLHYPTKLDATSCVATTSTNNLGPADYGIIPTGAGVPVTLNAGDLTINGVSIIGNNAAGTSSMESLTSLSDLINKFTPQSNVFATVKTQTTPNGLRARLVLTSIEPGTDSKIIVGGGAIPTIGQQVLDAGTTTIDTTTNPGVAVAGGSMSIATSGTIIINGVDCGTMTATAATNTSEQNAQALCAMINTKTSLHGVTAETNGLGQVTLKATAKDIILSGTLAPTTGTSGLTLAMNKARTATAYNGGSINTFDAQGGKHSISYYLSGDFSEVYDAANNIAGTQLKNEWHWAATSDDKEIMLDSQDDTGRILEHVISFDDKGVLNKANGTMRLRFQGPPPLAGGYTTRDVMDPQFISLNFGTTGKTDGLTQFMSSDTFSVVDQDGYTKGNLLSFNIGSNGVVSGVYDNGRKQSLAQLGVANFVNPAGLSRSAGNVRGSQTIFQDTENSGPPIIGTPQSGGFGELKSSVLEGSNVDLSYQFSDMILTQRGFQANARVITTSDEILQEIMSLKR